MLDQGRQDLAIDLVEAEAIDFEQIEAVLGYSAVDRAFAADLSEVPDPTQ